MQQNDGAQTSVPFSWGSQWVIPTLEINFYGNNFPVFLPFLSNNEKKEELEHGLEAEIPNLEEWKSHIKRSVHQDAAKTAAVDALSETDALLIMDWAMKFLPTSYRETQRDCMERREKLGTLLLLLPKPTTKKSR